MFRSTSACRPPSAAPRSICGSAHCPGAGWRRARHTNAGQGAQRVTSLRRDRRVCLRRIARRGGARHRRACASGTFVVTRRPTRSDCLPSAGGKQPMAIPFIVNCEPALASCLATAAASDTVLLIEDGVFGAVRSHEWTGTLAALEPDIRSRNGNWWFNCRLFCRKSQPNCFI